MSTIQFNVLVSLMIAIAFLVSESSNAQTNGYPVQKPILPQKYCGKKLLITLRTVCNDPYYSMYDNSRESKEIKMADYPSPTSDSSSSLSRARREMLNGPFARRRYRREFGDIYEECCLNMCTRRDLSKYCAY